MTSSLITPQPPCKASSRLQGGGLITSNTRNRTKPTSAPVNDTGISASVTSMPSTSSITTGPGIDVPEVRLGGGGRPRAGQERRRRWRRVPRPGADRPQPGVHHQARERAERAWRERHVADAERRCDGQGHAGIHDEGPPQAAARRACRRGDRGRRGALDRETGAAGRARPGSRTAAARRCAARHARTGPGTTRRTRRAAR